MRQTSPSPFPERNPFLASIRWVSWALGFLYFSLLIIYYLFDLDPFDRLFSPSFLGSLKHRRPEDILLRLQDRVLLPSIPLLFFAQVELLISGWEALNVHRKWMGIGVLVTAAWLSFPMFFQIAMSLWFIFFMLMH